MGTFMRLQKRKNQYGEYKIRYFINGKESEPDSYYTDDWEDAKGTFKCICKQENRAYIETKTYLTTI